MGITTTALDAHWRNGVGEVCQADRRVSRTQGHHLLCSPFSGYSFCTGKCPVCPSSSHHVLCVVWHWVGCHRDRDALPSSSLYLWVPVPRCAQLPDRGEPLSFRPWFEVRRGDQTQGRIPRGHRTPADPEV